MGTFLFSRVTAHALIGVTNKYGNLVMCYVDDVVIATPTLKITSSDWTSCLHA